ncbi:Small ubiquitin-like modifier 1 [Hibiscus syriacus]|uniref:Small ubiquitin-like modifier 1 n=1 Tax=Hibiscus syriacus TaxID=106335 RepID=A0A6A3AZ51_HIBSY|nr:Small ubiquitin-like modifier 1 [Hibiscus syriacus]
MNLMEKHDDERFVFPLTSLQIGDLQSYLSDLSLFLATRSNRFYILVHNRPWLRGLGSWPAHLWWQLMVIKSRSSPLLTPRAVGRERRGRKLLPNQMLTIQKSLRGGSISLMLQHCLKRGHYYVSCIGLCMASLYLKSHGQMFETDTSLAIEAKFMRRWEFESIDHAVNSISSWFSGEQLDQDYLKEYLNPTIAEAFYDIEEEFDEDDEDSLSTEECFSHDHCDNGDLRVYPATVDCKTFEPQTPIGPYKRRKARKVISTGVEVDVNCEEIQRPDENSLDNSTKNAVEATKYRDVLLLFRFDDRDLPFKLQQIITPDLRLLRLLEAGLPSWVIVLQSYPGFCHIYRPWMCPLARALYVSISVITVLIGFYDLYKNVPVLKATAARLCGPLFDWIETWEMVSRIKYLGTMLFLHNCQKAVRLVLTVTRAARSFFSFLCLPLAEPFMDFLSFLLPIWNMISDVVESFFSVIWIVIGSLYNLLEDLVEFVLMPICFIGVVLRNIATPILYPTFWFLWEILYAPIRLVLALARFVAYMCRFISLLVGDIWQSFWSIIQLASASESTVSNSEVSMWRSLWNDIFSQVFRALRSILNGFVAFFTACNRHRLRSCILYAYFICNRPCILDSTRDPRRIALNYPTK